MDSQRAKEVLMRYRPSRGEDADPELTAALELAKREPELNQWFERHCAFQTSVSQQFKRISVPSGLGEKILAGHVPDKIIAWWKRPVFQAMAAAAAVTLLATLVWFGTQQREENSFSSYRGRMVRMAQRMYRMDMVTNDLSQIRQFLAKNEAPANYVAPVSLEKLPGDGCAILHWHGKTVSLVCYDLGNRNDLYFFVINRADLPDAPVSADPQFTKVGRLMTASWSRSDKTYVLAGRGDEAFLRRFSE